MRIHVQRERRRMMSQVFLYCFYIIPRPQRIDCVRMPLRYNYDKPEKPPYIKERIGAGVVGYREAVLETFSPRTPPIPAPEPAYQALSRKSVEQRAT